MASRITPEWMAWARNKVAADRAALVASMTAEQLAEHDAEEQRRMDAIWAEVEAENQDQLERVALASLGEDGVEYLMNLKPEDYAPSDVNELKRIANQS